MENPSIGGNPVKWLVGNTGNPGAGNHWKADNLEGNCRSKSSLKIQVETRWKSKILKQSCHCSSFLCFQTKDGKICALGRKAGILNSVVVKLGTQPVVAIRILEKLAALGNQSPGCGFCIWITVFDIYICRLLCWALKIMSEHIICVQNLLSGCFVMGNEFLISSVFSKLQIFAFEPAIVKHSLLKGTSFTVRI